MIVSIIQPSYLPWLGYFEQMALSDVFVYLDDVKYTRKDWRNRNRFKSPYGVKYISVPVLKDASGECVIKDACIDNSKEWREDALNKLSQWYKDSKYFNDIYPHMRDTMHEEYRSLVELIYALNDGVMSFLEISPEIRFSSELDIEATDRNMRIVEICKKLNASVLYDGAAAEAFIDIELFKQHGVKVVFQDYKHEPYEQLWGEYESHLSVLDLLMNYGGRSRDILLSNSNRTRVLLESYE